MKLLRLAVMLAMTKSVIGQPVAGPKQLIFQRTPPVAETTARVAELIGGLSDESFTSRQRAAKRLLEMGPAIEPQLRRALQQEEPAFDPFVKLEDGSYSSELDPKALLPRHAFHELNVLISHLEAMRQLNTSRVTLHYKNEPLTNVLHDLGRQLDAETYIWAGFFGSLEWQTNRVTLHLDRATFWEAQQAVGKSLGLALGYSQINCLQWTRPPMSPVSKSNDSRRSRSATVSGPLQIRTASIEFKRLVDYEESKKSARVKLTLVAMAEPKLWFTGRNAMVSLNECVDSRGRSFIADDMRTFAGVEGSSKWHWKVPLDLAAPTTGGRIKRLKGQFNVAVCVKQAYLTITNLLHAQGQFREYDGLRMTVAKVVPDHDSYQIAVELSAPAGAPYAATFADSAGWDVHLFDESRQPMRLGSLEGMWLSSFVPFWSELRQEKTIAHPEVGRRFDGVRREAGRDIGRWTLIMSKRKTPATLLWQTPEETRWLTVPFELRDIHVP